MTKLQKIFISVILFVIVPLTTMCGIALGLQETVKTTEKQLLQAETELREIKECLGWKHMFKSGEGNPEKMDERQCNSYGIDIMENYY